MSTFPDSCPHCAAGPGPYVNSYLCGTYLLAGRDYHKTQSKRCLLRQRDQLRERVSMIEAQMREDRELADRRIANLIADRDSWANQADQRVAEVVEAVKQAEDWKAYAMSLEDAGEAFAEAAEPAAWENWVTAKETKP